MVGEQKLAMFLGVAKMLTETKDERQGLAEPVLARGAVLYTQFAYDFLVAGKKA